MSADTYRTVTNKTTGEAPHGRKTDDGPDESEINADETLRARVRPRNAEDVTMEPEKMGEFTLSGERMEGQDTHARSEPDRAGDPMAAYYDSSLRKASLCSLGELEEKSPGGDHGPTKNAEPFMRPILRFNPEEESLPKGFVPPWFYERFPAARRRRLALQPDHTDWQKWCESHTTPYDPVSEGCRRPYRTNVQQEMMLAKAFLAHAEDDESTGAERTRAQGKVMGACNTCGVETLEIEAAFTGRGRPNAERTALRERVRPALEMAAVHVPLPLLADILGIPYEPLRIFLKAADNSQSVDNSA